MVKPDANLISRVLRDHDFLEQRVGVDSFFVRPGEKEDLFERIEVTFVGRRNEAFLLGMALSAVFSVKAQFRGLILRGGLEDLCTEPENGRVWFTSKAEQSKWAQTLGELAPKRVREFATQHGGKLLAQTEAARMQAHRVFQEFIQPTLRNPSFVEQLMSTLTAEQHEAFASIMVRPLVIGAPELTAEYQAAVSALIRAGDEEILEISKAPLKEARAPHERIRHLGEVRDTTLWKIRLLVDLILRQRGLS